ncbi:MAG: hypothetical protein WA118_08315 [Carboxydocellales bacterium]
MFEQNRNAHLWLISAANILAGTYTATADVTTAMKTHEIPGITAFGYDHELGVERKGKGQFGKNKPIGLIDEYGGIKGNFDAEGVDGENAVLAVVNKIARASFVNGHYNKLKEFFLLANIYDDDGVILKSHFCDTCKIDSAPKSIGADAKRFSFQGITGNDFMGKKLRFHVVDGNATPVTACTFPTTEVPYAWVDEDGATRYALLVLKYKDTDKSHKRFELAAVAAAGYYSETVSAVTLHADNGLAANDKLVVVYLV